MAWHNREAIDFGLDPCSGAIARFALNGRSLLAKPASELPLLEIVLVVDQRKVRARPLLGGTEGRDAALPGAGLEGSQGLFRKVEFGECVAVSHGSCAALASADLWPVSGCYWLDFKEDGTFSWHLALKNETRFPVREILYPRLGPIRLPGTADLLYPHHAGEKIHDVPASFSSERYLRFGRAESTPTPYGYAREINYCGLASMTWMDLTDGDIGLYAASYDPSFPVTGLRVETGGPQDPWVTLSFRKYVDIEPANTYMTSPVIWRVHSGDWHEAAREYRRWFDQVVKQEEQPADLVREAVISPHYQFRRHEGIAHRFAEIPDLFDRDRMEFQSRHFFIAGWNHLGFDSHYPDYNPDLELGTPLKLHEGVRYIHECGGFTTFYINSRIMDRYSEYLPSLGQRWLLRDERGEPIRETYGPAETVVLCPSCPEWRSYLEEFAVWMCQAYGARGIYFDQLGSATPLPCYASHTHSPVKGSSGFNLAYVDLIERTTRRLRALRPDAFLMIENCGDIYSSRVFANVAWNGAEYDEFFNLYKFTFPEHTLINMVNPRNVGDPALQEELFSRDLARAFVLGSIFWFEADHFDNRVRDAELRRRMLRALKQAIHVRLAAAPYLAQARFMDDLGLGIPEGLRASRWEGSHDDLILVANHERRSNLVITLRRDAPAGGLRCRWHHKAPELETWRVDSETCDWQCDAVREADGEYCFPVPPVEYSVFRWNPHRKGEK